MINLGLTMRPGKSLRTRTCTWGLPGENFVKGNVGGAAMGTLIEQDMEKFLETAKVNSLMFFLMDWVFVTTTK